MEDPHKRAAYERAFRTHQKPYWNGDVLRDFDFSPLFEEFGFRFDEKIQGRFFCPRRNGTCGWRKRFFNRAFSEALFGFHAKAVHDLPLSPIEALTGTEREVRVQSGLESKRYLVRIPPGVRMETLLRLPIEKQGRYEEVYLRVRPVDGD